ncbi:molybdopterin biosynthesis protein MoeY [Rhodocyclaceae bacterium SMB388]
MADRDTLLGILDRARWAPSGDNTQPWRFEIVSDTHIAVHGFDTRSQVLYDFDGRPSQMAHGALLETLRIAASARGLRTAWRVREGRPDTAPIYDVELVPEGGLQADALLPFIETRTVQRRPMRTTPLGDDQRAALAASVGPDFDLQFFDGFARRRAVARLLWRNAHIRLTCPEAFHVHRDIIEWGARFSADRIPEQAVGVDPATAKLMKWVMHSWERVAFFNRYLMGTIAPRVQLDLLPALACAAHLLLKPRHAPQGLEDHVRAGVAMQRLWLTAAAQGLHLQPQQTPVIFRWYVRAGRKISAAPAIDPAAAALSDDFERLASAGRDDPFAFFCRVGRSAVPTARSVRKELEELML